eukprot:gene9220-12432_t
MDSVMVTTGDQKQISFIHNELPHFFGIKETDKQIGLVRGRHPNSFTRNGELWSYHHSAAKRRERIYKGHRFWNVVENENLNQKLEQDFLSIQNSPKHSMNITRKRAQQLSSNAISVSNGNSTQNHALDEGITSDKSKINGTIKSGKSSKNILQEMNVDFKNKSLINFGMSFIIINYLDQILYVNNKNELRCKSIESITPTDRIRFKLIDLQNPANPSGLKYGDNMWIQCLENSENADNSFQQGYVLSTKLFGPPKLNSMHDKIGSTLLHYKKNNFTAKSIANNDNGGVNAIDSSSLSKSLDENMILNYDSDSKSLTRKTTIDSIDPFTNDIFNHPDNGLPTIADNKTKNVNDDSSVMERDERTDVASVCGDIKIIRIMELKQREHGPSHLLDTNMSDEKASRYNSKQSVHLGKWNIHSALRNDKPSNTKRTHGVRSSNDHTSNTSTDGNNNGIPTDPFVYSLSPIFIQQDQYCIGTTFATEHHTWPKKSRHILQTSKLLTKEESAHLHSHLIGGKLGSGGGGDLSHLPTGGGRPSFSDNQNSARGTDDGSDDDQSDGASSTHNNKPVNNNNTNNNNNTKPKSDAKSTVNNTTTTPSSTLIDEKSDEKSSYGCIRKIVKRGYPYDFIVDRKCVWKFCLFEQFSSGDLYALSENDKAARQLMDT